MENFKEREKDISFIFQKWPEDPWQGTGLGRDSVNPVSRISKWLLRKAMKIQTEVLQICEFCGYIKVAKC